MHPLPGSIWVIGAAGTPTEEEEEEAAATRTGIRIAIPVTGITIVIVTTVIGSMTVTGMTAGTAIPTVATTVNGVTAEALLSVVDTRPSTEGVGATPEALPGVELRARVVVTMKPRRMATPGGEVSIWFHVVTSHRRLEMPDEGWAKERVARTKSPGASNAPSSSFSSFSSSTRCSRRCYVIVRRHEDHPHGLSIAEIRLL
jgi:hypothetical protein